MPCKYFKEQGVKYIINGGKEEFMFLKSPHIINILKTSGVNNLLIIPFAMSKKRELEDVIFYSEIHLKNINILNLHPSQNKDKIISEISNADALYFTGGIQRVLIQLLNDFGIENIIKELIKKDKIRLIGGSSAGAKILGSKVLVPKDHSLTTIEGLDLIKNYIIDPHFNKINRKYLLKKLINNLPSNFIGLGIDEYTTITMNEEYNIIDTFGEGKVTKIIKNQPFTAK